MEKCNRNIILVSLVLAITLLFMNFISSEINMSDPLAHQRYLKIINEFNRTDWVPVSIEVFLADTREEVISSLSDAEFKSLKREYTDTIFSGEITKQGLDKLVNNPNIRTINLQELLSLHVNESDTNQDTKTSDMKMGAKYNWLLWLIIIVIISIIIGIILKIKKR